MTVIDATDLPELPRNVVSLVADGVYGLYVVADAKASYLLVVKRDDFHFVAADGSLVDCPAWIESLDDVQIGDPVLVRPFPDSIRIDMT